MFQTQVYINPAQGVAGDFASANYPNFQIGSTGLMVADDDGVTVGAFAALNADGTVTSVPTTAPDDSRIMFVHNELSAQIVTYLAEASMTIQAGQRVSGFRTGDFYAVANAIGGSGVRGESVLWDVTTGQISVGGTATATLVDTGFILISETATAGATVIISKV